MHRLTTTLAASALLGLAAAPLPVLAQATTQQSGGWLNRVLGGQGTAAPATPITATAADTFLNAHRGDFTRSMNVLNGRQDLAGDLGEAYANATPDQQQATRSALGNLATGLAQNATLARQAPALLQGIGGQGAGGGSQLLGRLGLLRTAASLLGLQASSLGSLGSLLPSLFGAVGMTAPVNPARAAPVDLRL